MSEAGAFCWVELATPNPADAAAFYAPLLGWQVRQPPDARHMYTVLARGRQVAAGCFQLPEQLRQQGVPPHWLPYVAVNDAGESSRRAAELGGRLVREPFDALEMGRMAVVQDPQGALFGLWQSRSFSGFETEGGNGAFAWAELLVSHPERAAGFYGELFGWRLSRQPTGYWRIANGAHDIAGIPPAHDNAASPHWRIWFQLADCDAAVEVAEANRARTLMRPASIESVGRIAVLLDPQGAEFALVMRPS